ncbi:MAG TPA: glycosyltransferase family 4 protein [Candidatus Hydrogenedentes bacterium]|jgi:glycosyltransferase involved in cell wall biosynthesis|nr:glycosyltransferase family 4 protein [Candidatus Hydrogenedentota bacterium]HOR51268.1 glycosyltransferase family 4 protein [Candidatus Hydrogenedentota bacterium]HPK25172.1 glycosyltransferase family 4 protein [Candidatus Hydrogenedentota bacterium]
MKLRIAMVGACPFPAPQGSQVFMHYTADCLRRQGHEVHLVVYGYGVGEDPPDVPIHRAVRVPFATKTEAGPSLAKPFQDATLALKLRQVVRKHKIQVVCAHNYEALLAALLVRKRPLLYFAHNAMYDELPYFFSHGDVTREIGRFLDRTIPRLADAVIAPHKRLAGYLVARGCEQERVFVVPPPIDASPFEPMPAGSELPPVLYAGNLDSYQNLSLLFKAMGRVRKKYPDARLMIATASSAAHLDAEVIRAASLEELSPFLSQDGVFAAPRVSWSGYPIKMLNAMAAAKAVVACESAAYPLVHEKTGLITPDNDVQAYASALIQLLGNASLRTEMGRRAREQILKDHQPETVGARLSEIALSVWESRSKNAGSA